MDYYTHCVQVKNKLKVVGYTNGQRRVETIPFRPYLFVPAKDGDHKTIFGKPCMRYDFDNMWDAREFIQRYEGVMNFEFYGMSSWANVYIYDEFIANHKVPPIDLIHVCNLDIETNSEGGYGDVELANKPIDMITISRLGQKTTLGYIDFNTAFDPTVTYIKCANEKQLLRRFLDVWNSEFYSPDVVSGWNVAAYDIRYIINRIKRIIGEDAAKRLSPVGIISTRQAVIMNREITIYEIAGVAVLDYIDLYDKFIVPQKGRPESYRLDYIASEELGIKKLEYSEYGNLNNLYKENPQLFGEYNVRDVVLIDMLEDKMRLIALAISLSYDAGINFSDVLGTVKPWDNIIHAHLRERNIVVPYNKISEKDFPIQGGHVKAPIVGKYKWVVAVDLSSSYPHQIWQYNIGPETFVDRIDGVTVDSILSGETDVDSLSIGPNGEDYIVTGNGCRFRRDNQSHFSILMETGFGKRKIAKHSMLEAAEKLERATDPAVKLKWKNETAKFHNIQHGKKIQINGFYGSLANKYNRWFNPDFADCITACGRLAIRWAERALNLYLNKLLKTDGFDYIIAIDTDSVVGESLVVINGEEKTIADWFEQADQLVHNDTFNQSYVKAVPSDWSTNSSDGKQVNTNGVKYIMKHKVKKRMFKITVEGKSVTVTEDHSICVLRRGKLQDVKPTDLTNTDKIISIDRDRGVDTNGCKETTNNYKTHKRSSNKQRAGAPAKQVG